MNQSKNVNVQDSTFQHGPSSKWPVDAVQKEKQDKRRKQHRRRRGDKSAFDRYPLYSLLVVTYSITLRCQMLNGKEFNLKVT